MEDKPAEPDDGSPVDKKRRLSKAEKKRLKYEELKETRKIKRKQYNVRRKQRLNEARSLGEEIAPSRRTVLKSSIKMETSPCKTVIVLDCSFNNLMSIKDIGKLAHQIAYCYGVNRRSPSPVQFMVTSMGSQDDSNEENALWLRLKQSDAENWDIQFKMEPFQDLFPRERIVYLCAESEYELPDVFPSLADSADLASEGLFSKEHVYVIGGLVDHNHQKGLCHRLAQEKQFKTARIPFDRLQFDISGRTVLSLCHVFEIMSKLVADHESWHQALESVIPKRKRDQHATTLAAPDELP